MRVLRHADGGNHGASASRNMGITSSVADFVAFLDADDFMLEGRFEPAQARFAQDPSIDGVYDAVGTCLEGETARDWWAEHHGDWMLTTVTMAIQPEELFGELLFWRHGWFCTDGIVVRRQLFQRTGLFDTGLHLAEDSLMWRKMALAGRLVGGSIDRAVAMRRIHGNNTIIRYQQDNTAQHREMLRRLLRWSRRRKLRESDWQALITALVRQIERPSYHLGILARAARQQVLRGVERSAVVAQPCLRSAAGDATGWTAVRRRLWRRRSEL